MLTNYSNSVSTTIAKLTQSKDQDQLQETLVEKFLLLISNVYVLTNLQNHSKEFNIDNMQEVNVEVKKFNDEVKSALEKTEIQQLRKCFISYYYEIIYIVEVT